MIHNKSFRGDKYIGFGFIGNRKINHDITINANPILTTHPSNNHRTKIIDIEVYL